MLHHCTTLHHHPHDFCRVSFASSAPPPRAPPHERAVRHSSEFAATRHAQRWEDSKTTGAARARCHSRPERATWGLRPLTTLSSAIFSRARSATPRSDRFEDSKGKSALPRDALIGPVHLKSHLPSLHCFTRTQAKHHHHHVSVCLACISIPTLTSAPWPPLTRFPPTAEHPSRMRATTRSATPRPDLHNDKRVPALPNHNYFVQVREFLSILPPACPPCPCLPYPHPRTLALWTFPSRDRRSFRISTLRPQRQVLKTNFAKAHHSSHTKCRHPMCPHNLHCPLRLLRRNPHCT
jgi:hypothetical protein